MRKKNFKIISFSQKQNIKSHKTKTANQSTKFQFLEKMIKSRNDRIKVKKKKTQPIHQNTPATQHPKSQKKAYTATKQCIKPSTHQSQQQVLRESMHFDTREHLQKELERRSRGEVYMKLMVNVNTARCFWFVSYK